MIVLSSPFRSSAAKLFHMLPDDTDVMSEVVEKVAKNIKAEIENIETRLPQPCRQRYLLEISKQHPQ